MKEGGSTVRQKEMDKFLFELSYLNTTALFALKAHVAPQRFSGKLEDAWESALMKSSRHIRK